MKSTSDSNRMASCLFIVVLFISIVSCKKTLQPNTVSSDEIMSAAAAAATYQLVWSDEFNGTSVNQSNWTFDT